MKKSSKLLILLALVCTLVACCVVSASAETEGYYTYTVTDGEATITDVDTAISGEVVIPDTLGGAPVTIIGDYAFNRTSLTSVTIPYSVTTIRKLAFSSCKKLESLTIPAGIDVGALAFEGCTALKNITITKGYENDYQVDDKNGKYYNRNLPWTALKENCLNLTIEDGVTKITDWMFSQSFYSYVSIELPRSVTSIGDGAFTGNTTLMGVSLPKNLTSIGDYAFADCINFGYLRTVVIPDAVTSIGDRAFANCDRLSSLLIPVGVTSIGENPFIDCDYLIVHYEGSREKWNSMNVEIPDTVTVYCYDGPMEKHTHSVIDTEIINGENRCIERWKIVNYCACGYTTYKDLPPQHTYTDYKVVYESTCTSNTYMEASCDICSNARKGKYIEGTKLPHADNNHDGRCDSCNIDTTVGCSHICHKGSSSFIYKIARFFWKLFKTNKTCACGMYHY